MKTDASSPAAILNDFFSLLVRYALDILSKGDVHHLIGVDDKKEGGIFSFAQDPGVRTLVADDEEGRRTKIATLLAALVDTVGMPVVDGSLEDIYTKLEKKYTPLAVNQLILPLLPPSFLEKFRLNFLSKEDLQTLVVEKTKSNNELVELDRRKTEFLQVVAHQLRTPLTGMKWALAMLSKSSEGLTPETKKILASCIDGNNRMIATVTGMLRADRVSEDTWTIHPKPTDVVALLTSIVNETALTALKQQVTITFTHDEGISDVPLDEEMMRFAFQNLIDNAIHYSHPGDTVRVAVNKAGQLVRCSVADTGIGIPSDQQAFIFSRFFRGKNAVAHDPNGNGLGLFIVKSVVEKHGGTITFSSKENEGTTFYVTLNPLLYE